MSEECIVCFEFTQHRLACRHCVCKQCESVLLSGDGSKSCPMCRAPLQPKPVAVTTTICNEFAKSGLLYALQWAHANGFPWDVTTTAAAAGEGHLEILKWLREKACPWDETTIVAAARGGHLHVAKWARDNFCPWTSDVCAAAAQNGHLNVLRWARDTGCPWGYRDIELAEAAGHVDVVNWLKAWRRVPVVAAPPAPPMPPVPPMLYPRRIKRSDWWCSVQ